MKKQTSTIIRDRIKELRRVPARELIQNPKNWRRHPKEQAAAMAGMLAEVGYADALLARETPEGLMLIDGHLHRDTTPDQDVPVLVLDVTEAEADKILLTLDPLAGLATVDPESLQSLVELVKWSSEDLAATLAPLWPDVKGAAPEVVQDEVPIDKAAELQKKWSTELGQTWDIAGNQVHCGDCRVIPSTFFRGNKIRLVWTDPPYGVSYGAKTAALHKTGHQPIRADIANDDLPSVETGELFTEALRAAVGNCEAGAACYASVPAGPMLPVFIAAMDRSGFQFRLQLVWAKNQFVFGRSDYHFRHENILYGWLENGAHVWAGDRSQDSIFQVDKPHVSDLHPTTKPVELVAAMIANSSQPTDIVYDPFCGSGTTLVAAHQLGRIGYGIEIDPGYVAVTLERLSALGLKPELIK